MTHSLLLLILIICGVTSVDANDSQGLKVMRKVKQRPEATSLSAEMEMVLIGPDKSTRVRQFRLLQKNTMTVDKMRMTFSQPASVAGTSFLIYSYGDATRPDDQWIYFPRLGRVKRLVQSEQNQSFMGSDFSYADLGAEKLEDFHYILMKHTQIRGTDVWQIKATPVSKEVIQRVGYTKAILFISKESLYPIRSIQWLSSGNKIKLFEITKLQKIEGIWVPTELYAKTKQGKKIIHQTVIRQLNVKLSISLDPQLFTERWLSKQL